MIMDLHTPCLIEEECIFSIHNNNRFIQFQFYMIIYYIMHLSCRKELYKYFILNNTNFYLSSTREKGGFILLGLGLGLELWIWCLYHQRYLDRIQFHTCFLNDFGLTSENSLLSSVAYSQSIAEELISMGFFKRLAFIKKMISSRGHKELLRNIIRQV